MPASPIIRTWSGNRDYLRQLPGAVKRGLVIIFGLQGIFFLYFVFRIPFHYDESWSYMYFSGRGFLRTALFYPLPNNHIFYNLMAGVFVKLPLDPEIGTRLPSYFAGFISTWYFFKLSYTYFSQAVSLVITALFASAYPFVLYSVEARGYSFLILFTVLLLYSADRLTKETVLPVHRCLYWGSMVAGLYSLPSFIYVAFAMNVTLAGNFIIKKEWACLRACVLDNLKAALVTVLLYAPVVFLNGIKKFIHPDGFVKLSRTKLVQRLGPVLSNTLHFLTGINMTPLILLVVLIPAGILFNLVYKGKSMFLAVACTVMLVSPLVILFANPIIPYPRTWSYLIVPLVLMAGYLISFLFHSFRGSLQAGRYAWPAAGAVVLIMLLSFMNFQSKHRENYGIDYTIRSAFAKMGPAINTIGSVGYTGESMEYYVAEDLQFQCMKRDVRPPLKMDKKESLTGAEDVLIIAPDSIRDFQLGQYQLMGTDSVHYYLYQRLQHP